MNTTKYKDWIPCIYETTAITLERKIMQSLMQLESFNRIGIALSSGIDSVLLLRLLRHVFPNKEIIAFHYIGVNDELEDVQQFSDAYADRLVTMSHPSVLETLKWQTTITKEPMWDAFDYILYSTASQFKCDVMIDGSGADELFGGYTFRYDNFSPTGNTTEAKFYAYMDVHQRDWVEDQAHLFGPEIPFDWNMIKENIIENFGNPLDTISQIFMADYNGKLARLFAKKHARFSNVYSIPIYSPYLDEHIIEYGTHLEPSLKIGKVGKLPLRQIAARYDISPTIEKLGFSHDTVAEWNKPEINKIAMEDITDPACQMYSQGLISWDWIQRHVHNDKDCQDVRYVNKFFQLLALEQWLRHRMHME
jgi:asparagine synthase (glutamine-hydrolysing)